jgi:hypothetical protein
MLKTISISFLILFFSFPLLAQVKVVDAAALGGNFPARFLPDVEGKVVIDESYFHYLSAIEQNDAITVYPGWPVSTAGSNERGGVYGNLDDDPELELIYSTGYFLYAINIDGSHVTGWPKALDFPTDGAPAYGDIDGDGFGEIVVTTHQVATYAFGTIYAFKSDGTDVPGFPVATVGGAIRTPVLADLDGDGALEIILAIRRWPDGFIHVYRGDGTVFPGWPQRMDYVPGSAVAVGDIDGDNLPEIIAESYYSLHAYETDGTLLPGFPYSPGVNRVFSYSSPVLADLDEDGVREIICGDHSIENGSGAVHIVNHDGSSWDGWPKLTGSWVYGPPSVGDIDGDGLLDIAVGDQTLSASPINQVYAWTAVTGNPLPGFPIPELNGINSQIILADLDGDNKIELLFDDNKSVNSIGQYRGFNHDGTEMEGWPLLTSGSTFFINPFVVDINFNGILDISGGGEVHGAGSTNLYLWNANVPFNSELAVLPILQYNTRHNGVYGDTFMVGIEERGSRDAGMRGGFRIFPNPAQGILNFKFSMLNSEENYSLRFYDILGRLLTKLEIPAGQTELQISIEDFEPGIYTVLLIEGHSLTTSRKFVISR